MGWNGEDNDNEANKAWAAKRGSTGARPSSSSSGGGDACLIALFLLPFTLLTRLVERVKR